jgi:hypothetical protein
MIDFYKQTVKPTGTIPFYHEVNRMGSHNVPWYSQTAGTGGIGVTMERPDITQAREMRKMPMRIKRKRR